MLACRGQPHERVQAGLDALRSEDYRTLVAATHTERSILMMQGLPKHQAKDTVPKPPVERLPGSTKLKPWLTKRLADIQERRVARGSVKYVLAIWPPDQLEKPRKNGIYLRLVEMDKDFDRQREKNGRVAWPRLNHPGVLRVIAAGHGLYWGNGAETIGKRRYAEMKAQMDGLERARWERSADHEVCVPASERLAPLKLEME